MYSIKRKNKRTKRRRNETIVCTIPLDYSSTNGKMLFSHFVIYKIKLKPCISKPYIHHTTILLPMAVITGSFDVDSKRE